MVRFPDGGVSWLEMHVLNSFVINYSQSVLARKFKEVQLVFKRFSLLFFLLIVVPDQNFLQNQFTFVKILFWLSIGSVFLASKVVLFVPLGHPVSTNLA